MATHRITPTTYVPSLHALNKWRRLYLGLDAGDVVVVNNPKAPRGLWPFGRVVRVFLSPLDGQVRNAEILIRGKTYKRPVQKLAILLRNLTAPGTAQN